MCPGFRPSLPVPDAPRRLRAPGATARPSDDGPTVAPGLNSTLRASCPGQAIPIASAAASGSAHQIFWSPARPRASFSPCRPPSAAPPTKKYSSLFQRLTEVTPHYRTLHILAGWATSFDRGASLAPALPCGREHRCLAAPHTVRRSLARGERHPCARQGALRFDCRSGGAQRS